MQNTYGVVYSWDESNNLTRGLYLFCHTYLAQMRILEIFGNFQFKYIDVTYLLPLLLKEKVYEK